MDDYYSILGVKKFSSQEEIKNAYRVLAKRWHPDRNQGDSYSAEMFKKISQAYFVLSKPELKSDYDLRLMAYQRSLDEVPRVSKENEGNQESGQKTRKDSLDLFMQKMKATFENAIFEDEDAPTMTERLYAKFPLIARMRQKARKLVKRFSDLIFEEVD